jgi:(p)ppGpp synthase/HD superfamily hydrolase
MIVATIEGGRSYATIAHHGQKRSFSGEPYVNHPFRVASILYELGYSTSIVIAAILHDVLEDTPCTEDEMRETFGNIITDLVMQVTEPEKLRTDQNMSKVDRKAEFNKQLSQATTEAQAIKLADIIDNTRDMTKYCYMDVDRASKFLFAKRKTVDLLTKGNAILHNQATKELDSLQDALLEF